MGLHNRIITSVDQANVEWLTTVLYSSGALTSGAVAVIEVDRGSGNWSTNAILKLRYTDGAKGKLPRRLFLKMVDADLDDEFFGPSEVDYYTRDYIAVKDAPLITCYDAAFSANNLRYHLLLDDLSQTHIQASKKTPTIPYGLALADGLAILHGHWWGASRLEEAAAPIHSPQHIRRWLEIAEPGARHIIDHFSNELKSHWPDLMRELFAMHPQAMIDRTLDDNGFTLIHGDAGDTNILVPRNGDRPIYFIDRQPFDWSLTTWLGVYDLAYAIILDWESGTRRRWEMQLLDRYHSQLIKKGVKDYSLEQLYEDYRLSIATCVYIAVEYCRGGINMRRKPVWLPMLQRSLTACDDHNCRELWSKMAPA